MTSAAELNQEFLASIIPNEGFTGLSWIDRSSGEATARKTTEELAAPTDPTGGPAKVRPKPQMRWVSYADKAAREKFLYNYRDHDLYFSPSSYSAKRRIKPNVLHSQVIFLDIDAGDKKVKKHGLEKVYKNFDDALRGFQDWLASCDSKVPGPSWVIRSGEGLHVYWHFAEEIDSNQWTALEQGLHRFASEGGVKLDSAVCHTNSLLRLPGSTHQSSGETVRILENLSTKATYKYFDLCSAFPPKDATVAHNPETSSSALPALKNRPSYAKYTAENNWPEYKNSRFIDVLDLSLSGNGCQFIAHAYNNQETIPENEWFAALSLAINCSDGDDMIIAMSCQHAGYDEEATRIKAAPALGKAYGCTAISNMCPHICETCQFKDTKIHSPLNILPPVPERVITGKEYQQQTVQRARRTRGAQDKVNLQGMSRREKLSAVVEFDYTRVIIATLPEPVFPPLYSTLQTGQLVFQRPGNEPEMIFHRPLYTVERLLSHSEGDMLIFYYDSPVDGTREVQIPSGDLSKPERILSLLGEQGVIPTSENQSKRMLNYIRASAANMQERRGRDRTNHYGWQPDHSFLLGDTRFTKDKVERAFVVGAGAYRDALTAPESADVRVWGQLAQYFMGPGFEPAAFALGLCAGSPLFRLIDRRGAMLHLFSTGSGRGKTTIVKTGLNIWGRADNHAKGHGLMGVSQDTHVARFTRLAILGSIPSGLDELTAESPESMTDFLYAFTQGRQRDRGQASSNQLRENTGTWEGSVLSTGNTQVLDTLRSNGDLRSALHARVIELDCGELPRLDVDIESMRSNIERNHAGAVGRVISYYVTQYPEAIRTIIAAADADLAELDLTNNTERYWIAMIRCAYAGLALLKNLNIISPDFPAMVKYFKKVLDHARRQQHSAVVQGDHLLEEFLAAHTKQQLVVSKIDDPIPDYVLQSDFVSKYVRSERLLIVVKRQLDAWLQANKFSVSAAEVYLRQHGGTIKRSTVVPGVINRQYCWYLPDYALPDDLRGEDISATGIK